MRSDADIAWAAGLFEGEGCWRLTSTSHDRVSADRLYAYASLAMTDEDVVRRFQAIVGVGTIYHQIPKGSGSTLSRKEIWCWRASARADFEHVAELLRPWLGERRRARLDEVLAGGHKVHECKCDYCWQAYTPKRMGSFLKPFYCSTKCREKDRPFVRATLATSKGA